MARILEYQQDKLASSAVGVPSMDKSGQIIGSAMAELGDKAHAIAFAAAKQRKDILDTSRVAELASRYETQQYDAYVAGQDDEGFQRSPEKFEKYFTDTSKAIYQSLGADRESPGVQRLLNMRKLELDTIYHKKVREWSRSRQNFNASTALTTNITRTSNAVYDAAKRGRLGDAAQLMKGLNLTAASSTSVLGPEEAVKALLKSHRDPLDALYAGFLEFDPIAAGKLLADEKMGYRKYFNAEEIQSKEEQVTQAVIKWQEQQAVQTLQSRINQNQAFSKALANGEAGWKEITQMPDDDFKKYAIKGLVALENATMTKSDKAFERNALAQQFKTLYSKNRNGRHSIEVLQDLNTFMVNVERAKSIGAVDAKTATAWYMGAVQVIKNDAVGRNMWNKMTSTGGVQGSNAIMKSWESVDSWAEGIGKGAGGTGAAKFDIFTNIIDRLDPAKKYTDAELENLASAEIAGYLRSKNANLKMSTHANGVLMKGGGYTPFRSGSSLDAVPGAKVDTSARKAYSLKMTDGSSIRGYLDSKNGKYYDRPVGGVEIK